MPLSLNDSRLRISSTGFLLLTPNIQRAVPTLAGLCGLIPLHSWNLWLYPLWLSSYIHHSLNPPLWATHNPPGFTTTVFKPATESSALIQHHHAALRDPGKMSPSPSFLSQHLSVLFYLDCQHCITYAGCSFSHCTCASPSKYCQQNGVCFTSVVSCF